MISIRVYVYVRLGVNECANLMNIYGRAITIKFIVCNAII